MQDTYGIMSEYDSRQRANYNSTQNYYNQLLAGNAAMYSNVLSGYGTLYSDVLNGLAGSNAATNQEIEDQYAKSAGAMQQGLISRGLGNSTVQDAMSRGLQYDRAKSRVAADNQYAGTIAGYKSNLGQAGLSAAERMIQGYTGLGSQAANTLAGIGRGPGLGELTSYWSAMNPQYGNGGGGPRVTSHWPDTGGYGAPGPRGPNVFADTGGGYGGSGYGYTGAYGAGLAPQSAPAVGNNAQWLDEGYDYGSESYGGSGLGDYGGPNAYADYA